MTHRQKSSPANEPRNWQPVNRNLSPAERRYIPIVEGKKVAPDWLANIRKVRFK